MKCKVLALCMLSLFLLSGCVQEVHEAAVSESQVSESQTTEAAEPYLVTFEAPALSGENITSDCFADSKLTMLNVWATYCNPCLNEMPDLGAIAASYETSEFQILGIVSDVSVYSDEESVQTATDLVAQTGADTYPQLLLSQSLYDSLVGGIDSVPTTFFVNQNSELLGYVVGAQSKETWEELIHELLAELE